MFNFSIRPATQADVTSILALTIDGIQVWGSHLTRNIQPWLDETCNVNHIASKLSKPHHAIFVAVADGKTVGTISLDTANDSSSHMGGLYCSLKKRGIGTALLQHVMDASLDLGYDTMECEIYENNVASLSLMKKHGAEYDHTESCAGVNYLTYKFNLAGMAAIS